MTTPTNLKLKPTRKVMKRAMKRAANGSMKDVTTLFWKKMPSWMAKAKLYLK